MLNNLKDAEILTKDELGIAHLTGYGVELTQKYRRYYSAVAATLARTLPPAADIKMQHAPLWRSLTSRCSRSCAPDAARKGHLMYLEIRDLHKSFGSGDSRCEVLRGISCGIEKDIYASCWDRQAPANRRF